MGLDISAYCSIKPVPGVTGDDAYAQGFTMLYCNSDFPGRADDVADGVAHRFERSIQFRAGSYGTYNAWREELAKLAGYPALWRDCHGKTELRHDEGAWQAESGPFWELINFSDCEGVVGAAVSAKLARDFAEHQPQADAHPDEWFRQLYAEWRKAFELAANGGAVSFH